MNILMTNDDGYLCEGFVQLVTRLAKKHNVYVCAPVEQRSTCSHSTSFHKDVKFTCIKNYCGSKCAYVSDGTPSDCVKFGCSVFEDIDVVISGPNNGDNFACDVLYSGTVAAAEEGVIMGKKSIAVSRIGHNEPYTATVEYIDKNIDKLCEINLVDAVLNINVPNIPYDEIKGVKVTLQGGKVFNDYYVKTDKEDTWHLTGYLKDIAPSDNDIYWAYQGYITLTPLSIYRTDYEQLDKLKVLEK